MPGKRPSTGGYSLGQGISPLVPLDPHVDRDPTKIDSMTTASHEDKPIQNGHHQGIGRVKTARPARHYGNHKI